MTTKTAVAALPWGFFFGKNVAAIRTNLVIIITLTCLEISRDLCLNLAVQNKKQQDTLFDDVHTLLMIF